MKILVCDDLPNRGEDTRRAIAAAGVNHEPVVAPVADFEAAIASLVKHSRDFLNRESRVGASCCHPLFDDPDIGIVILDNNLAELEIAGARHTAEALAGLIRAFTRIPYIVSLNKNWQTDFDLRYLVGDYQTAADLALNLPHLDNPGLWRGVPAASTDSFLPWYWPVLSEVPETRRCQERFVDQHLGEQILRTLGFESNYVPHLTRHAVGALSPDAEPKGLFEAVTFSRFFETSCTSLPIRKEREEITSRLRGDGDRAAAARLVVVRVVAAELERWFRRDVVGPQSVLVDTPHLLTRMPFLLGNQAGCLDRWNDVVAVSQGAAVAVEERYRSHLEAARFPHTCWTKSQCFWWPLLKGDAELNASFFEDHPRWPDAVFCEDISAFRAGTSADGPREFAAEFEGPWSRRHVAGLTDKGYTPASRFAL
ncbi:MAG: hypothetical protein OYL92_17035 [Acidobacteriota bacterium]|nr:hypothetical protein [Acidobacteriota bacterium]MDE3266672.1 hypothetical protein [Acidobacteriota bacterium]